MELSEKAQGEIKTIKTIEDKYGLMMFRSSLTHLFDIGHSKFTDEFLEKGLKQISVDEEQENANGTTPIVSYNFTRNILRCSTELSKFSIITLFAYIKEYVVVDI